MSLTLTTSCPVGSMVRIRNLFMREEWGWEEGIVVSAPSTTTREIVWTTTVGSLRSRTYRQISHTSHLEEIDEMKPFLGMSVAWLAVFSKTWHLQPCVLGTLKF